MLDVIATQDYGVSDDRSSIFATPAIKAYNDELRKANELSSEHMVAANNAYERVNKKKRGDEGWMSAEAAIKAYNEQVRVEIAKVASTAIKAYNSKASIYEQVFLKKGRPLLEGFTIVKVRTARLARGPDRLASRIHISRDLRTVRLQSHSSEIGSRMHISRDLVNCEATASQFGDWISEI